MGWCGGRESCPFLRSLPGPGVGRGLSRAETREWVLPEDFGGAVDLDLDVLCCCSILHDPGCVSVM